MRCNSDQHVEFEADRSNRFLALSDDAIDDEEGGDAESDDEDSDDDADDEESDEEGDFYSPSWSSEEERGPRTSNASPADVEPFDLAVPPLIPRIVPDVPKTR